MGINQENSKLKLAYLNVCRPQNTACQSEDLSVIGIYFQLNIKCQIVDLPVDFTVASCSAHDHLLGPEIWERLLITRVFHNVLRLHS